MKWLFLTQFCSDCTNLKPADHKVLLNYGGRWDCQDCRMKLWTKPDRDQARDELMARLVDMVAELTNKVGRMEK
jgi:hypothetical protein